eukprot:jgi/Tetstr1/454259/TSEL_041178.t1
MLHGTLVGITPCDAYGARFSLLLAGTKSPSAAPPTLYSDHPSFDEVHDYLHREVTLVVDASRTVRDFYHATDTTFRIRSIAAAAGALDRCHDTKRRIRLRELWDALNKIGRKRGIGYLDVFTAYPFLVMRLPADDRPFGLAGAMRIAEHLRLPDSVRCRGEMEYDIVRKGEKDGGGHTCYPVSRYFPPLFSRYGDAVAQAELDALVRARRLVFDASGEWVSSPKASRFREAIMEFLREPKQEGDGSGCGSASHSDDEGASHSGCDSASHSDDEGASHSGCEASDDEGARHGETAADALTPTQRRAVSRAVSDARVTVVIGPAGTGKTRVVKSVQKAIPSAWLCAPTGKAARRMGAGARTLHSFLATFDTADRSDDHHACRPRRGDLVVVDEASMLDFTMAFLLVRFAARTGLRLLFVGDPFQLPSVEWGSVMDDLVAWAAGHSALVRLDAVFRQGRESGVLALATAVRSRAPVPSLHTMPDVTFLSVPSPEELVAEAARHWKSAMIITPTNRVRADINMMVAGRGNLVKGDKVICLRNQDISDAKNGDIGTLLEFQELEVPPRGDGDGPGARARGKRKTRVGIVAMEDDAATHYAVLASDLAHAYAITVHKAQGSEWDTVCLATPCSGGSFVNRRLMYTAITRAKEKLVVISVGKAFFRSLSVEAPARYSLGLAHGDAPRVPVHAWRRTRSWTIDAADVADWYNSSHADLYLIARALGVNRDPTFNAPVRTPEDAGRSVAVLSCLRSKMDPPSVAAPLFTALSKANLDSLLKACAGAMVASEVE